MKIILFFCLLCTLGFSNTTLREKAQDANLQHIPKEKAKLLKLIDSPKNELTKEKIELGKILFFDPRLSKSNLISCNTCHNLGMGGVDGISRATGDNWQGNPLHLNSPTVYNAVFGYSQFWDGRSPDLLDQAKGPLQAHFEMNISPKELEKKINSIKGYKKLFVKAYGKKKKITFELIAETIALFEMTLTTPSRYDAFLLGNDKALSDIEKEGLELFISKRCVSCHQGVALGGLMRYFVKEKFTYGDVGGFSGNQNKLVKVPTLRNITQTAPYFHNGTVWNLKDAILEMGRIQLKLNITDDEALKIESFFQSLEGEKPKIIYPNLPR